MAAGADAAPALALYSGWGPEAAARNPGDALCHEAALHLLARHGIDQVVDIRAGPDPVVAPWTGDLIIGGGTVLPAVFEPAVAPGLRWAARTFAFGSGCLSAAEVRQRGMPTIDRAPYEHLSVVGLRGPLSCRHYAEFFGVHVDFVGDLAFALAQDAPPPTTTDELLFFFIENDLPARRVSSSLAAILGLYAAVAARDWARQFTPVLCTTGDGKHIVERWPSLAPFHGHRMVHGADELVEAIRSAAFVVSERLHPAIIALMTGTPFVMLTTTSKADDLRALMAAVGCGEVARRAFLSPLEIDAAGLVAAGRLLADHPELTLLARDGATRIRLKLEHGAAELARVLKSDPGGR